MKLVFPNGTTYDERVSTPEVGDYVEMLHKWMVDKGKNVFEADGIPLSTNGVPSVSQMSQPPEGYKPVTITKAMSDWWWKIQEEQFPEIHTQLQVAKLLFNLTIWKKAFNNKVGHSMPPDVGTPRNEYFTGDRKGQGYKEDMGLLWCWSEGSVYKKLGERRIAGETCVIIQAIDALKPSTWPTSYVGNEHLFTIATNASRDRFAKSGYRLDPFPPFPIDGVQRKVLVPLFVNGDDKLYVKKKYTKPCTSIPTNIYGAR
jgi:hypothetical protein